MMLFHRIVMEHLPVGQKPIPVHKHQDWRVKQHIQSSVIQFVVEHWRLSVEVSKLHPLANIKVYKTYHSNGEQHRKRYTMCESHQNLIDDVCIPKVNGHFRA